MYGLTNSLHLDLTCQYRVWHTWDAEWLTCCSLSPPAARAPSSCEGLPAFRTLPEHSVEPQRWGVPSTGSLGTSSTAFWNAKSSPAWATLLQKHYQVGKFTVNYISKFAVKLHQRHALIKGAQVALINMDICICSYLTIRTLHYYTDETDSCVSYQVIS